MKCRNCGHTEVGMYKEIRQIFNEMGISKDDLKLEIAKTIESLVRSTISEKISTAIENTVSREIRGMFDRYSTNPEGKKLVYQAVKETVAEVVTKELIIDVSLKEKHSS